MRIISEMSEGIPELNIRRDYGKSIRHNKLTSQLNKERNMRMDKDFQDARPDDMTGLLNLQTPQQPSAFEREMAGSYEQSLPRAESLGMDNELLSMAQDSLSTQKRMEDLSRNLGAYIATAEGNMGQAIPDQGIRRSVQEDNLYNTQAQMPYFRLPMYKHGGKVGAYKGGRGLLSMMPFSRRIV